MKKIVFTTAFLLFTTLLVGQENVITAKIIDTYSGEPLEGASIFLKSQKTGTTSNISGIFTFDKIGGDSLKIEISYVGYADTSYLITKSGYKQQDLPLLRMRPLPEHLTQIVVTSSRTLTEQKNIPARTEIINANEYKFRANTNIDDLLGSLPGVVVNRSWGIFSKNTAVTMRGLESSARTLILLNGTPLNKLAGGPVNWHLINPDQVERIEIIKGPASTIYGSNAVGGAINIITKQTARKFEGAIRSFYGSFDSHGLSLNLGQNLEKENRGLSYNTFGFYRTGDGYYFDDGINFDETDEKTFLKEFNLGGNISYKFNPHNKLSIDYKFHDDFRGDGKKVYEEDGSYYSYNVQYGQGNYQGRLGGFNITAQMFIQNENYYRQNESLNSSSEYRLYETNSVKRDIGGLVLFSRQINYQHKISFGLEAKTGLLNSVDDYMTSTDSISYKGKMDFIGLYFQDEMSFLNNRLHITSGIRIDKAQFYDGSLSVQAPSKVTGFDEDFLQLFDRDSWLAVSPKIAARYKFSDRFSAYTSIASGFNPPKIDDLCRSGKITKGFKLANPELGPEKLWNYEAGINYTPIEKISLALSLYYSRGYDFHNLVGTGDSIDTGGTELKPELRKLNISEVEIAGIEISLNWQLSKKFRFLTNYSYSHSIVLDFDKSSDLDDYAGNFLIEVPPHTLYTGLLYEGLFLNVSLDYSYTDAIWIDIDNTISVDPYEIWNLKLSRDFAKNWFASITIQNLLDNEFIDRKERKSPGRFNMIEIAYRW